MSGSAKNVRRTTRKDVYRSGERRAKRTECFGVQARERQLRLEELEREELENDEG